ncbi:MAG: FAD-dependent oxidoreductase [Alphaproteobacteria bacterium]|nr:FAD-dependent oxidoreductase [Alphaproteobacteria bacterium]
MTTTWDVIVVGAGTAGMPTATFAALRGARVLLIEQAERVGGTLWYSGGQMSAADTRLQRSRGIEDSAAEHFRDIMRITRQTSEPVLLELFTDHAGAAFDWLMDNGFDVAAECPACLDVHEPYRTRRSVWGNEGGLSVMKALKRALDREIARGAVTLKLSSELTGFLRAPNGAVIGVQVRDRRTGVSAEHRGENVVLTTGGYVANRELYERYSPGTPYGVASNPEAKGTGFALAAALGARVKGGEMALPSYGCVLEDPKDRSSQRFIGGPHDALSAYIWLETSPQRRRPWEIHVNLRGERFVREDIPSVDHRECALRDQPDWRFFILFDEGIRQNAPKITTRWSEAALKGAFGTHPSFLVDDSLNGLARQMGVDEAALSRTVAEYNAAVASGLDAKFGREFLPRAIAKPPFYAVQCFGLQVMSPAGLDVDADLRVLDQAGKPIGSLYAAGEVLGHWRIAGDAYAPGTSVTPAITFGKMLGERLLSWSNARAAAE